MQVTLPGYLYKWRHLMANFGANTSDAIWWPNFEPLQVVPFCEPIQVAPTDAFDGQIHNQYK